MTAPGTGVRPWHVDAAGAAACAVLTVLGVVLVVLPVLRLRLDHAALRSELRALGGQAAELESAGTRMQRELDRLDERLADNRLQLQGPGYLNTRIARIIETASSSGIVVDQTRSDTARRADLYQAVPIQLSGTGGYPGCAAFLHRLHGELPDTGLVSMELTGNTGRGREEAHFRFDLIWYAAAAAAADARGVTR